MPPALGFASQAASSTPLVRRRVGNVIVPSGRWGAWEEEGGTALGGDQGGGGGEDHSGGRGLGGGVARHRTGDLMDGRTDGEAPTGDPVFDCRVKSRREGPRKTRTEAGQGGKRGVGQEVEEAARLESNVEGTERPRPRTTQGRGMGHIRKKEWRHGQRWKSGGKSAQGVGSVQADQLKRRRGGGMEHPGAVAAWVAAQCHRSDLTTSREGAAEEGRWKTAGDQVALDRRAEWRERGEGKGRDGDVRETGRNHRRGVTRGTTENGGGPSGP